MKLTRCNYCGAELTPPFGGITETSVQDQPKVSGRAANDCGSCGSTVLERQLKLYLDQLKLIPERPGMRILHFNPEPHFVSYLASLKPEIHILALDKTADSRYDAINIEDIPYGDGTFDLVIANGQLEAASSPEKTLDELSRVLKSDGLLLVQTSLSHARGATWENTGVERERLRYNPSGYLMYQLTDQRDLDGHFSQKFINNVFKDLKISPAGNPDVSDEESPFILFRRKSFSETRSSAPATVVSSNQVMVSVHCITYNHANFIAETLASIIQQKTSFRFEIVIGEDFSTDDTFNIVRTWADQYPDLIRLLPTYTNLGVQSNWKRTFEACTGRYVAICEGDDRWTDPLKLQKQFTYMEKNPGCILTFGKAQAHKGNTIDYNYIGGAKTDLSAEVLQLAPPINTLTVMFRNLLGPLPPEFYACGACDLFIWSLLGQHGYGHYMSELLPCIYNMHAGGLHSLTGPANQHRLRLKTFYAAFHYYFRMQRLDLASYFFHGVVNDALYIKRVTPLDHAQTLLGSLVSEMSKDPLDPKTFDVSALGTIIERIMAKPESYNVD